MARVNHNLEDHEKDALIDSVREHAMMDQDLMREIVRYYVDEWTRKEFDDWFQDGNDDCQHRWHSNPALIIPCPECGAN